MISRIEVKLFQSILWSAFLALNLFSPSAFAADDCTPQTKVSAQDVALYFSELENPNFNDLCKVQLKEIHPTQFAVGYYEVKKKFSSLEKLEEKDGDLKEYLKKHPLPIVIAPDQTFFIIDHHHLARALWDSNLKDHTFAIIVANYANAKTPISMASFWRIMKQKNWVYLVDETGNSRTIRDLESVQDVSLLKDDPFRSLSGAVRCDANKPCDVDGYIKTGKPFEEFLWAEHFRRMPELSDLRAPGAKITDKNIQHYMKIALAEIQRLGGKLPLH